MRDFKKGIILLLLTITSCNSQATKIDGEITVRQDENVKIEFNFYPSSGVSVIYTIKYYGDSLCVKKLEPRGNEVTDFKKHLSDKEVDKIKQVVSTLKKRGDVETDLVFDTWRVELLINDTIYYNELGGTIETLPTDVKSLLNLLIEESSVEIELYGFS